MRTEFNTKSTNILFELIIEKLGLSDGDLVDISEQDGKLIIEPVTTAAKKYVTQVNEVKKEFSTEEEYRTILDELYPHRYLFKNTHSPDGKAKRKFASKEEYRKFVDETFGSIDDPTFVEPPEIKYESPREAIT